jgi:hypothetical protein
LAQRMPAHRRQTRVGRLLFRTIAHEAARTRRRTRRARFRHCRNADCEPIMADNRQVSGIRHGRAGVFTISVFGVTPTNCLNLALLLTWLRLPLRLFPLNVAVEIAKPTSVGSPRRLRSFEQNRAFRGRAGSIAASFDPSPTYEPRSTTSSKSTINNRSPSRQTNYRRHHAWAPNIY